MRDLKQMRLGLALVVALACLLPAVLAAPALADPTNCRAKVQVDDKKVVYLRTVAQIVEGEMVDFITATLEDGDANVQLNLINKLEVLKVKDDGTVLIKFETSDGRVLTADADGGQMIWGQTDFGDWRAKLSELKSLTLDCPGPQD